VSTAPFELLSGDRRQDRHEARATMAREVRAGLARAPRSIPPKYFYDEKGSRLFDAICELPEYYLTRAERALLERHADDVVARCGATTLVEIGSGMARKTGLLVRALCARATSPRYVPFDIAPAAIEASARALLGEHPALVVRGVVGDFARDLDRLDAAAPTAGGPRLFAFLGSTIGNLDEHDAPALLRAVAHRMSGRDRFLLGVDLVKDARLLHAAYNDSRGVTAAFNENVLRVVARELGGAFDLNGFEHLAFYDEERQRVEMHLVSRRRQALVLRDLELRVELVEGERIMTEISRKFTRASVERMLASGGMALEAWLAAPDGAFALAVGARA
jgi:L-histidine N-alpha-methyltransferase